jgi:putative nucleotidyltransferase with HDIG domain
MMSTKTKTTQERMAILIVEDSPTQAEQLRYLLDQHGYLISLAKDGRQAMAFLNEHKPALVISDINMPEINGFELCKLIKEDDNTRDTPVILLTALSNPEDVLEGLACGADSFITKPYSPDYLIAHIQQILANWKLRKSDLIRVGVEVLFAGKRRFISADQQQILGLLLSTYEAAVQRNKELVQTQEELRSLNENLEDLVEKRTAALSQEIVERKQAEKRVQRQLEHLTALSSIDRVISSNFDLKLSLSQILNQVTKELGVDAADILILIPRLNMLEFGAERGFRTQAIRKAQVRLGQGYTGRVALERRLIQIPNLKDETGKAFLTTLMASEDFVCYYGVPLVAKGQVKGVLEVFHRTALTPDEEWFDFLNTLAGQTAIAIENSALFESLQLSNLELFLAYDATIEGWSHAMDLRDKETEGHTQRVTEMTLKLARTFGLSEADLVQVRWGALLHDIGKMGVPDGILLNPESLTDEEWVAMKKHPTFAHEMLAPIRYLRQALDIPYCHHEKWDGTGYPRGLKGTQIPLVARIFAVVDVWDALTSDRPYRKAWSEEKAREHIQAGAGTHFDPQVVKTFFLEHE